jgi:uncharacterized damage-inducible protein DinB
MTEMHGINIQLKNAHQGGAWHGPALNELLAGITAAQAAQHPLADTHSIWELVNHIAAWEAIVARRLSGEEVSNVPNDINFPPVTDPSESAWQASLQHLAAVNQTLRDTLQQAGDERLQEPVPGKQHTLYFEAHGALQHSLYHAGQIALLKKLVR